MLGVLRIDLFITTQSQLLMTLKEKEFENTVGKRENTGLKKPPNIF